MCISSGLMLLMLFFSFSFFNLIRSHILWKEAKMVHQREHWRRQKIKENKASFIKQHGIKTAQHRSAQHLEATTTIFLSYRRRERRHQ